MRGRVVGLVLCLSILVGSPSPAVTPDEILDDPQLEQRARDISAGLRCMVCQNQSIDDSDAALAKDLRVLVRQRLVDGDSDAEVIDYVVSRYGEFVLLKPRFTTQTLLLWAIPLLALSAGIGIMIAARRTRQAAPTILSAEERSEIDEILRGRDQDN